MTELANIPERIFTNRVFSSRAIAFNEQRPCTAEDGTTLPVGAVVKRNGDVDLSLYAPAASAVAVVRAIDGRAFTLKKSADGLWRGVMPYETPGPKALDWLVDGVRVTNPLAPVYFGYGRPINYIDIPDPEQDFFLIKDVSHGTVSHEFYFSRATGGWESCVVYTPPGYERSDVEYPALYLQHGMGENENSWVWQGKVNFIADNLIASGKATPCVIVMNNGMVFPTQKGTSSGFDAFCDMLLGDCIPFIESKYRIKRDKWSRAMAGLSMGSMQTSRITLTNPDKFGYIGLFSCFLRLFDSGFSDNAHLCAFDDLKVFRENYRLLFRAWGSEDAFAAHFEEDDAFLDVKGASPGKFDIHKKIIYPGAHDWYVWRMCIRDFLPLIF